MRKLHKGTVKEIKETAKSTVCLRFEPDTAMEIKPGQFVSILCEGLTLRRPFSVADFDEKTITVLFKKKGKGTAYLANLKPGDEIDFIGAMGNGFDIQDKRALVIGAGIGIAPVYYLNKFLTQSHFVGAFNSEDEVPKGFEPDEKIIGGTILDHLERLIADYKPEIIYACGPSVVLKAISKLPVPSQLALEKVMACGIGVCKGCAIKIKKDEIMHNMTICYDGPVFKGGEIVWD